MRVCVRIYPCVCVQSALCFCKPECHFWELPLKRKRCSALLPCNMVQSAAKTLSERKTNSVAGRPSNALAVSRAKLTELLAGPDGLPALFHRAARFATTHQLHQDSALNVENDEQVEYFLFELLWLLRDWQRSFAPGLSLAEFIAQIESLPVRTVLQYVEAVDVGTACPDGRFGDPTSVELQHEVPALAEEDALETRSVASCASTPSTRDEAHMTCPVSASSAAGTRQRLRHAREVCSVSTSVSSSSESSRASARDLASAASSRRRHIMRACDADACSESDQEVDQIDSILERISNGHQRRLRKLESLTPSSLQAVSDADPDLHRRPDG